MWSVDNKTPYAAAGGWIRDPAGKEVWIVAVKATFDIERDGSLALAAEQEPVYTSAVAHPGLRSLLSDTDLGPRRPGTDVLVVGSAHAPSGIAVTSLDVAWQVGPVNGRARVVGDRSCGYGLFGGAFGGLTAGLPSEPEPFVRMPLVWERAQFHADFNPVGCGHEVGADGRIALPNIMAVGRNIRQPGSSSRPVGFGPISSDWRPRRDRAGTYDRTWERQRSPLLPLDLDARHWHSALPSQQVTPHMQGGEPVALRHLAPAGCANDGRLSCTVPKLTLSFETRFHDGSVEYSRSVLHAVVVRTEDVPRLSVVHHVALECHSRVNLLDRTIVRIKRRPLERSRGGIPLARPLQDAGRMAT